MSQSRQEKAFAVVGLSKVVRNDDPAAIGALWQSFREQDIRGQLGTETGDEVYCVYHDYTGGVMAPYRMTIGFRTAQQAVPAGLHRAEVPAQRVQVFDATGPMPESLIARWQAIWDSDLPRSFLADYDVYGTTGVRVHVGVDKG